MRRLGLPQQAEAELHFVVWEASSEGWTLAEAAYEHVTGSDLTVCELIAVIEQNGRVQILRKLPFQKTDAEVPEVTRWSPIDIADVDGDGRMEVVLEGDAYENHLVRGSRHSKRLFQNHLFRTRLLPLSLNLYSMSRPLA